MSSTFELYSLGELVTLERRPVQVMPDALYAEIGIYSFGKGIFHKAPRTGLEVGDKDLFLIKDGDFILQITFAWEGAVGLASAAEDGMYGSVRFPTFRVDESRCLPKYLVNYFRTPAGRAQLVSISPGSAGRNRVLGLKRIPEITIPLPPLSEQRRIVARIEALAARIEEARGLRREATGEADLLIATTPTRVFEQLETLTNIKRPLKDSAKILGGGTPSKANYAFWQGDIPWVSPKDMKTAFISDTEDHISELALQSSAVTLIPADAVLIVVRSGILRRTLPVAITKVPVTINQDMKALIPTDDISSSFLAWWLKAKEPNFLERVKGGTTVQSIIWDDVSKLQICIPSLSEQQRIVAYLDELQAKADALRRLQAESAAELEALLPSVLDQAFRGAL